MRVCKKSISVLLVCILLLSCLESTSISAKGLISESNNFSGDGNGTCNNPYKITNELQLNEIRNDLSAYYVLENDIDLSDYNDWQPIGNAEKPFQGTLDGHNFVIKNMMIKSDPDGVVGLFGYYNNANIRNINLSDININIEHKISNNWYAGGNCWSCRKCN